MNISRPLYIAAIAVLAVAFSATPAVAQNSQEDLAKQLANPVSSLVSVPFQYNVDHDIGPDNAGDRTTLNIQPVIPFNWNSSYNLISRTIVPVIDQQDIAPGAGDQFGLGDTVQSFFLSPKAPTSNGWIWGAGPVFLVPTATDDLLGADKWGIGPTGVALKQQGAWTYGGLANHIWSFAGDDDRPDVNATFLQPFVNYTTPTGWSYIANLEATHDWENDESTVPMNLLVMKVTSLGSQRVQIGGGLRYYFDSPENGPEGWGLRLVFTLLYPR